MANNLNKDLTDRVVILGAEHVRLGLRENAALRAFRVVDGFGALSFTSGSAIIGEFLYDGSGCRMEGWMVERFAIEDEVVAANAIRAEGSA